MVVCLPPVSASTLPVSPTSPSSGLRAPEAGMTAVGFPCREDSPFITQQLSLHENVF